MKKMRLTEFMNTLCMKRDNTVSHDPYMQGHVDLEGLFRLIVTWFRNLRRLYGNNPIALDAIRESELELFHRVYQATSDTLTGLKFNTLMRTNVSSHSHEVAYVHDRVTEWYELHKPL